MTDQEPRPLSAWQTPEAIRGMRHMSPGKLVMSEVEYEWLVKKAVRLKLPWDAFIRQWLIKMVVRDEVMGLCEITKKPGKKQRWKVRFKPQGDAVESTFSQEGAEQPSPEQPADESHRSSGAGASS